MAAIGASNRGLIIDGVPIAGFLIYVTKGSPFGTPPDSWFDDSPPDPMGGPVRVAEMWNWAPWWQWLFMAGVWIAASP